ncbi:hypothetical protein [Streptomyces sp. NBC_01207]|uniref:hypothetical protein n=1 Tax=Streptomyces sp. NBC_01207 TaxID=2903772 RepID=UPI002E10D035|nr:hypothetical protein OG457_45425 [Streptomyces sp. NBC_01207]WTA24046.1 hypothetical protein OG365_39110 [Streptomyces sp. NBC_00853]
MRGAARLRHVRDPAPGARTGRCGACVRFGHFPFYWWGEDGQWHRNEDRFEKAGVSAHYWRHPDGVPRPGAVSSYGRTGPQVLHAGIPLAVRPSGLLACGPAT